MKKMYLLLVFAFCMAEANAAADYPTGGMVPLVEMVAKMDSAQGPFGDAAWPWIDTENGRHILHSRASGPYVFDDMMYDTAFGIYASSDFESDGKTFPWANCFCGKYAALRGIDWSGKNYLQKEGEENNIVFKTSSGSYTELYCLEFLKLSGNRFRNFSIVGHVSGIDSLVNLTEVDFSNNPSMEYFSIDGAPNLKTLKVKATTVNISGSTLLFSKMADIQATTLNYMPAGTVHLTFPSNLVDFTAEAAIGTQFSNWSVTPVSNENGMFSFSSSQKGQTISVDLTNASFPDYGTIPVEIKLTTPYYEIDPNIDTAGKLDSIRFNLSGEYTLTADIDLSAYIAENYPEQGWLPIGDENVPFTGKLIGNGHTISGLYIDRDTSDYVGLFGTLGFCRDIKSDETSNHVVGDDTTPGAEISDLALVADRIVGRYDVGALAGIVGNKSRITGVYVKADVKGYTNVGGLCGTYYGKNTATRIEDCYISGCVSGENRIGGIVGHTFQNEVDIFINRVYVTNKVRNIGTWYQNPTGGLIGKTNGWYGGVKYHNCFAINDTIDGLNNESTGRMIGAWVNCSSNTSAQYRFADNAVGLNVMEYNNTETDEYIRLLPSDTGEDGIGEEWEILNKRNRHGFNITADSLKKQETYEKVGFDFGEMWLMGNREYPLPVLKKLDLSVQPAEYPIYLDAKSVYSIKLEVDTLGVVDDNIISLHSVFPYWEKNGIMEGTEVPVYIRPNNKSELESLWANGVDKTSEVMDNVYTLTLLADTKIVARFKEKQAGRVDGIEPPGTVSIYPNVVTAELVVRNLPAGLTPYTIVDIAGKHLMKGRLEEGNSIDVSYLPSGVYFIRITGDVVKFVKK